MIKPLLKFSLIFVITGLILWPQITNFCHQINRIDYDTQNLFLWDYLHELGYQPYKDTFYPYGFLFFNKSQSLPWFIIYALLSPLTLTVIYMVLIDLLFPSVWIKLTVYIGLIYLILTTLGVSSYTRYGLILAGTLLSAWLIYTRYQKHRFSIPILAGILAGLVSFASGSDGLYLFLVQILLLGSYSFIQFVHQPKKFIFNFLRSCWLLSLGVLLGLIPMLVYLVKQHILLAYLRFYQELVYLGSLAKLPYTLLTISDLFIITVIVVGLIALILRLSVPETRKTYSTYIMVAAWLCLAFMQQKNLIRPFNAQMSFYATMLVLTLLSNLFRRPTSQKTVQNFQSWLLILIFFSSLFISFKIPLNLSPFSTTVTAYAGGNLKQTLDVQAKLCSLRKINWARLQLPPDYDQVIQALKDQPLTSYITFPYDPLFYLIGNQPPLPYPNAYESAFIGAQTANINHLQSHQTQAVIYSFPETPIDWAPDYVRNLNFTRYVLTHFSPFQVVGRFTLLKLDSKGTVYNQGSQTSFPDLYDHFTQLNWGYLPISEGDQFSDRIILDGLTRGFYSNTDEANASLLASPLSTQDLYLILDYVSQATPAVGQVTFTDVNDQATTVTFGLKANRKPLLKLANLPLFFYGNRLQALTINPAPVSFWLVVNDKMRDTWQ